jgi:secretion/DNA translocation related TadE-like protein
MGRDSGLARDRLGGVRGAGGVAARRLASSGIGLAVGERHDEAGVRVTSRRGGEDGSASLLVAGGVAALVVFSMGVADVARVMLAASRAQTSADSAALASAQALALDEREPLPEELAADYASLNGAVLETCTCDPGSFAATVEVRLPVGELFLFRDDREVVARARAEVDLPSPT